MLDFYRETLDNPVRPTQYQLDGEWRPLEWRVEEYYGPDGEVLAVDTVYFTHRGPVALTGDEPLSMRWVVLEESGTTRALVDAARAGSVTEWLEAMESWFVPAQNGIVADAEGNIAIRSMGRFPIRPDNGNGTQIRDGSRSASEWQGFWPLSRYPFALNPERGFLASANQQPLDPGVYDGYLGVNWPSPWRAMRIAKLLRADSQVTPDAMRGYHTDPGNAKADLFVPAFLEAAQRVLSRVPDSGLEEAVRLLGEWDRRYTKDNERAVLFESAMGELTRKTWDELVTPGTGQRVATPGQSMLAQLLAFPENVWWDDRRTPDVVEKRDDILAASLEAALESTMEAYGPPESGGWRWDGIRHTNIRHLLGFSALSALNLPVQGGPGNLSPSAGDGSHGASWRMVVELAPEVRAWTTYPGGQSGNPASPWYDNRISQWVDGELDSVLFPQRENDLAGEDVAAILTLRPEGS